MARGFFQGEALSLHSDCIAHCTLRVAQRNKATMEVMALLRNLAPRHSASSPRLSSYFSYSLPLTFSIRCGLDLSSAGA